jgi:hypothetical protein
MNTTHATAAAAGGATAAGVIVISYVAKQFFGVELPDDVVISIMALLTPIVHILASKFGVAAA